MKGSVHKFFFALILCLLPCAASGQATLPLRAGYRGLAELLDSLGGYAPTAGNTVEIFRSGKQKMDKLIPDILFARDYVHMTYFIFDRGEVGELTRMSLAIKGEDGLDVRYIVEDLMDFPNFPGYFNSLRRSGVDVNHYGIFKLNRRNHRKIVVIDGKIAYCGGMNIAYHYVYEWKDTHLRLTGPCVASLEDLYEKTWRVAGGSMPEFGAATGEVQVPEDAFRDVVVQVVAESPRGNNPIMDGYCWMLDNCKDYVYMQTPYFTPPGQLMEALKRAAGRGLDVRLLIPAKTDMWIVDPANRSYYKECLEAGIKIYQSHGQFDHSKTFVADDYLAGVGSANLDGRSLELTLENNTVFYDESVAMSLKARMLSDMEEAEVMTIGTVDGWNFGTRLGNAAARILAPQL